MPLSAMDDSSAWPAWEPYERRERIRITETSCCGAFEWACQGGLYFILRTTERGTEEAARGLYRQARNVWESLVLAHALDHMDRGAQEKPRRRSRGTA